MLLVNKNFKMLFFIICVFLAPVGVLLFLFQFTPEQINLTAVSHVFKTGDVMLSVREGFLMMLHYLNIHNLSLLAFFFTASLFCIALLGFMFNRSHVILALVAGELLLLPSFLNFSYFSYFFQDAKGHVYALIILVIAACEAALGLSLVIHLFAVKKDITLKSIMFLRG